MCRSACYLLSVPRTKKSKPKKPLSVKQRASDETLRDELRRFDVNKFGKLLAKAVNPPKW